jgi:hypothetical protein
MRVAEVRIYKDGKLVERCEREPIRDAERSAKTYADMVAQDECPRGTVVQARSARDYRAGPFRVRAIQIGSY